jgi:hypothetical protein
VIIGLFILLAILGSTVQKDRPSASSSATTAPDDTSPTVSEESEAPSDGVTLENFQRLQSGMSYSQAVAILGEPGVEMSRTDLGGTTTVMYQWKAGGLSIGNMKAMFQNGRLVSKAQFGLR